MRLYRIALPLALLPSAAFACVPGYATTDDAGTDSPAAAPMDGSIDATNDQVSAPPPDATSDAADAGGDAGPDASVSLADLVLLMHMDETSWAGTGAVIDSSGQHNDGTASGNAVPEPTAGKFGGAGSFDGDPSSFIAIYGAVSSLQPTTALTYSAWIYPNLPDAGAGYYPGIIAKRGGFMEDVAFTLWLSPPPVTANVDVVNDSSGAGGGRFASTTDIPNGQWIHLAVVYDGTAGQSTLYVNGQFNTAHATPSSIMEPNVSNVTIANLPNGGGTFMGLIDEVAIWNRALSAGEIAALYAGGAL